MASGLTAVLTNGYRGIFRRLCDPRQSLLVMGLLVCLELFLNLIIVQNVKYTEIDWKAYMQEVEGVINGTLSYRDLKGDTGPLVYPAGFVYIYLAFYHITDRGTNILLAQYIYIGLYLLTLVLVFSIYKRTLKVPPWALVFMCCTSYRIHSIYVLRLFNDPIAMMFLYAAINMMLVDRWALACIMFSCGVSVKMNILLFAPGLLLLLLSRHGFWNTVPLLALCGIIQVALGLPFLLVDPLGYIERSFDIGRQFLFTWTVNWRMLPLDVFESRYFHGALLCMHLLVLIIFYNCTWSQMLSFNLRSCFRKDSRKPLSSNDITLILFSANFIGMCFSRSLHYQFYVWYFHTLAYLLWSTGLPNVYRLLLLGAIELCWNTYPSTTLSSAGLHACHVVLVGGLWFSQRQTLSASSTESGYRKEK